MSEPGTPARPDLAGVVFGEAGGVATRYVDLLATTGVEWGLIGPRETDRLWERHVFNSAAIAELVPEGVQVVDVGSGAGLPGIPLALRRPDLRVTLLEPLLRRATFLTQAVETLALTDRVRVVRARAEDHDEAYDAVVSRALAPLPRLLGWCLPLTARGGSILALKGRTAEEELAVGSAELAELRVSGEVLSVHAYDGSDPATVVRLRRV